MTKIPARYRQVLYGDYQAGAAAEPAARSPADRRARRWYLRNWLPESRDAAILDAGCGAGGWMAALAEVGYTGIQGVDATASQVGLARSRGLDVDEGDLVAYLEERPGRFDQVLLLDVLEHQTRDEALDLLVAIRRALRTDESTLVVMTPNGAAPRGLGYWTGDLTHEQLYGPDSLRQALRATGFGEVEFREVSPPPLRTTWALRAMLWRLIRALHRAHDLVETGATLPVYTRNMLARTRRAER